MGERAAILAVATKGAGSNDEARILSLLDGLDVSTFPFDRADKRGSLFRLLRTIARSRPSLVVLEGTGLGGGLAVLAGKGLFRVPYVVSSGDAVGPFLAGTNRALTVPAWLYEWLLCRCSAGFIGWTPYLVGRALTFGAPRAVTAAGFAPSPECSLTRDEVRDRIGVRRDACVIGIVGSLDWNHQKGYCYGFELVRAIRRSRREDIAAVIVGAGSGDERLRALAGDDLGHRIFLPGPIPPEEVVSYLAAMDIGSIPQSLDQVGALRYTTKISEYVAARLPIVTGRLPLAYDVAEEWSWRLPGHAPWSDTYIDALAALLDELSASDIEARRKLVPARLDVFDEQIQRRNVGSFIREVLDDR